MIPDPGTGGRLMPSLFRSIQDKRCWQRLTAFKPRRLVILLAGQVISYKVPGSISSRVDASYVRGCVCFPHHIAMGTWRSHCCRCPCFHAWHVRCFGRCRCRLFSGAILTMSIRGGCGLRQTVGARCCRRSRWFPVCMFAPMFWLAVRCFL